MYPNEFNAILGEFEDKYRKNKVSYEQINLQKLFEGTISLASEKYELLPKPVTCSKDVFVSHWLRETLHAEYILKSLKPVNSDSNQPNGYSVAISQFFTLLPLDKLLAINEKIGAADRNDKLEIWNWFNLPIPELEKAFVSLVDARNELAKDQLFVSLVELHMDTSNIPLKRYQSFINGIDDLLFQIDKQLHTYNFNISQSISIFDLPCALCSLTSFPFKTLGDVYEFVQQEYPQLVNFRNKIAITESDQSYMIYKKEEDKFIVFINRNVNIRHQSIDLLHELGHVVGFLEKFKTGIDPFWGGKYQAEYDGAKIQHNLIKNISDPFYSAFLVEMLILFWKVLFEIQLYSKPHQNMSKLYAETFNRCFFGSNQKRNDSYLVDEPIITKPLRTLPHAVAHFCVLTENRSSS